MATIRVSSLPEIKVDRITDDDYYIVNDGDITTSKLSFKQMVLGIAQKDIDFSGDIKFSGDVEFTGDATGPFPNTGDVYTKTEIDALLYALEQYDVSQDDKLNPLIVLSGEPEGTSAYRDFPKGIISSQATCRQALTDLEAYASDNRELIDDLTDAGDDTDAEIVDLASRIVDLESSVNGPSANGTDGLLYDVSELKSTVSDLVTTVGAHEISIVDHETRISTNETDIASLKAGSINNDASTQALVTLSGVPNLSTSLGTFTGTIITDNATNKSALQEIETEVDKKAPIDNPTFTTKITAPRASNVVPSYYTVKSSFPSPTGGEGHFAYANAEKAGYVSTSNGWERIVSYDDTDTIVDRTAIFNMLGYTQAFTTESAAAASGVAIGDVYVYSATNVLADGILRTNMFTSP